MRKRATLMNVVRSVSGFIVIGFLMSSCANQLLDIEVNKVFTLDSIARVTSADIEAELPIALQLASCW
ncbi:hypothetical protein [Flavihumibacter sp.]|uniref:hypothetical protein n=1 Tax=Flavihumibacter sp. TaxID=1913981 RepID=UPI002FCB1C02